MVSSTEVLRTDARDRCRGCIQAGADAIGLNFYEKSRRFVSIELGSRLSRIAAGHAVRVGVFVNASPETIARHVECCDLDAIQLHGDEEMRGCKPPFAGTRSSNGPSFERWPIEEPWIHPICSVGVGALMIPAIPCAD